MSNGWSIFFVSGALLVCNSSFPLALEAQLTPAKIAAGERAILRVVVSGASERPQISEFLGQQKDLILLEKSENNKSEKEESGNYVISYAFTSYQAGAFRIPPLQVKVGPDTLSSEAAQLEVTSSRGEQDTEIREDFGVVPVPIDWMRGVKLVSMLFLVYAAFYFMREWLRKFSLKNFFSPKNISCLNLFPPPKKRWLREQIRVMKLNSERGVTASVLADRWHSIVRHWYGYENKIPAICWTTKELDQHLSQDRKWKELSNLLVTSDFSRFAMSEQSQGTEFIRSVVRDAERVFHVA